MSGSMDSMLGYLSSLARQLDGFPIEHIILVMLMDLELDEKKDGFEHLRTAIYIFSEKQEQLISQSLYSAVASQSGKRVSDGAVERAIRTVIDDAWRNHCEMWRMFFPSGERPSNIKFVARMAKYVDLWKGCCKAYERQSSKEGVTIER